MSAKRALVTGGAGFVGANLALHLALAGHEVHVTGHREPSSWRLEGIAKGLPPGVPVQIHPVELAWDFDVRRVFDEVRPQWVFHLATHGAYPHQRDETRIIAANTAGFRNVVGAALVAKVEAFVNAGSSSEYGPLDHAATEEDDCAPRDWYARSKLWATSHLAHVARHSRLQARTLRLYSVYGPWEEPSRLIPRLLAHGSRGDYPPLASAETAHDFVHVDDACRAFVQAAETIGDEDEPGAIYNIGSGEQTTLAHLADRVGLLYHLRMKAAPQFGSYPDRPQDTAVWVANVAKAGRFWMPTTPLLLGLAQTDLWLRDHPELHARYGYRPRPSQT